MQNRSALPFDDIQHLVPFQIEPSWNEVLKEEWQQPYIWKLVSFLAQEKAEGHKVYPADHLIFNAFQQTPYHQVKVVIIGQDPYHGAGQAHGLSFSVPQGIRPPPSLHNIFKELHDDLGLPIPQKGSLIQWAQQGVLLLNATLTVRHNQPLAHHKRGWEIFTDAVVSALMQRTDPVIFVLWGKNAMEKCRILAEKKSSHFILKAPHPSPYSAHTGFLGCRHFSKINFFLESIGKTPIDWRLSS